MTQLVRPERSLALLTVGISIAGAAFLLQRLAEHPPRFQPLAAAALVLSAPLATGGAVELAAGYAGPLDLDGAALLAVALGYALFAVPWLRRARDFATVSWGIALVLAAAAFPVLLLSGGLVLAWAAAAALAALAAEFLREQRFLVASYIYLILAAGTPSSAWRRRPACSSRSGIRAAAFPLSSS